jgi:hypothetical protein
MDVSGNISAFIFSVTTHKPTWFTTQKPQYKETTPRSLEDSGRRSGTSEARKTIVMKVSVRNISCPHYVYLHAAKKQESYSYASLSPTNFDL